MLFGTLSLVIVTIEFRLFIAGADQNQHSYELNIFTKPDCYDTVYQNGNRTWFHFGIQGFIIWHQRRSNFKISDYNFINFSGGDPGSIMKINILNLNKQVKLFSQGMQPVFRYLPSKAEWERVRDRLIINVKLLQITLKSLTND